MNNPFLKTNVGTGYYEFNEVGKVEVEPLIEIVHGLLAREEKLSDILLWVVVTIMVAMGVLAATSLFSISILLVVWGTLVIIGWFCFRIIRRKYRTDILRDFENACYNWNVRHALSVMDSKAGSTLEEIWKSYGV